MNKNMLLAALVAVATLAGCTEYREYTYRTYPMPREQVYEGMLSILREEGFPVAGHTEGEVNGLPEVEVHTDWNQNLTGSVYRGTDVRLKAWVKISTMYTERRKAEFQPLTPEEAKRLQEYNEEIEKKADLEHTRVGVAVIRERRDAIDRPFESDWIYEGPDGLVAAQLLGRFEAYFGTQKQGGAARPSSKSERLREQELRERQNRR